MFMMFHAPERHRPWLFALFALLLVAGVIALVALN